MLAAILATTCASFGCGGYTRQQVYAPLKPISIVPVKLDRRNDYVEFRVDVVMLRIYHVVISERVVGPAIIIPTPRAKETVRERPLEIELYIDVPSGTVVAFDPRRAMVLLADGRELAPEFSGAIARSVSADSGADSLAGQVVLSGQSTPVRFLYNVPRVGLGSFTLHLPVITVNSHAVELPPVVFRLKRRGFNS